LKRYIAVLGLSYVILAIAILVLQISSLTLIGVLVATPLSITAVLYLSERFSLKSSRELKGWGAQKYATKLFNNSSNILYLVNREGNILRANKASREVLGHDNVDNLHLAEIVHPEDLDLVKKQLKNIFQNTGRRGEGARSGIDVRLVEQPAPGNSSPNTIPTTMRGSKVTEQAGVLEFINNKKINRLMKKLRESGARYRYLIEDAIDTLDSAVMLIDKRGEVVWVNKTMEDFFKLNRRELIGLSTEMAMSYYVDSFSETEEFKEVAREAHRENERINNHVCSITNDYGKTTRILEYRSIPIETERYQGGRIEYYIDITEVKRLEEDLRRKTERLKKSNEKLEEFSRGISHDLKAPLQTLEGYSQILLEDYEDKLEEDGVRALEALSDTTGRLRDRIESLLTYSSINMEDKGFDEIDIGNIISDLEEDLKYVLEDVNFVLPEELPRVYGNRTLLTELFSNLITNAVKYNDKEEPRVEIGWKKKNDKYLLWVEDNGQGIKDRYLEKIFKVFEKLNPRDNPEGTGIGLAVCKRIVEEHRGDIWAESELGEGTTFFFTLPAKKGQIGENISGREITNGVNFSRVNS